MARALLLGAAPFALGAALLACTACTHPDSGSASSPGALVPAAQAATTPLSTAASTTSASAPGATPALAPTSSTTAASAATARFIGRFDRSDKNPRFAWSGSHIVGRFQGTQIAVRLKDDGRNVFQIVVDGEPKAFFKTDPNREVYPVAENLQDGVHEVVVSKRTEARYGEVSFLGFDTTGKMLPVPPAPERRIEMIGDSITTGYGNEGPGPTCSPIIEQHNEYVTYGAVAARELKADHHTIAWSGKTIMEMTELYDRTLPARTDSRWDFQAWVPDMVVINLGTNNFALADPGEARFVRLYTALVEKIRQVHPKALIVCVLGPMLTDVYPEGHRNLTLARQYMRTTVGKIKEKDTKVELLELPEQKHSDGMGCGFHPSPKTHKLMAERLVALAREKLGW